MQVLADRHHARLHVLHLSDTPPDGQFAVVPYDLDYLPPERREAVLSALRAAPVAGPTGVHSYNLTARTKRALRRHGVLVARRPTRSLIRELLLRARAGTLQPDAR